MGDGSPERLFPLFVTSKDVTPKRVDEFLSIARTNAVAPEARNDPYIFSLQRTFPDAGEELERLRKQGKISGSRPPTSANAQLDFENAKVKRLAAYVVEKFGKPDKDPSMHPPMDDQYFVMLDDRTARDDTCLLVAIPWGSELDDDGTRRIVHSWKARKNYFDERKWTNPETEEDIMDIKAARVSFDFISWIQNVAAPYASINMNWVISIMRECGITQR